MQSGFHVGRIFGINIRIDWSLLLIFFLIAWNLSAGFNQIHPEWGLGFAWLMALIAAVLFFVSVLAHEISHSLVAQAQGVPVTNITLFLFGGVSNIQREPPSPRAEFLITIVGPITSLVIGGALLLIARTTFGPVASLNEPAEMLNQLSPLTTLLVWLGSINVVLGVFNMIPGFPLDGGRILRSILWGLTDNLRKATRWASWVGQAIAILLIVTGLAMFFGVQVPFFGTGFINGLWLIFIGWFLNNAAIQSYRRVVVQNLLNDVPVSRIMRSDPPTVAADITVRDLVDDYVMRMDDHAFPVVEAERIVGFVTLNDIRSVERAQWDTTSVREIMTPVEELVTVKPQDEASDALTELMKLDVRQLPVVAEGRRLVGVLRRSDIMKWLQLQSAEQA